MSTVFTNPYTDSIMWSLQGGLIQLISQKDSSHKMDSTDSSNMLAATEQIDIAQQRTVRTRMPLVGNTSIKLVSAPTGNCTLTTIIGPHHVVQRFMDLFGDACQPFTAYINTVSRVNQICKGPFVGQKLIMKGCTGDTATFRLSVQQNIAVAQGIFRFQFDTLEWEAGDIQKA